MRSARERSRVEAVPREPRLAGKPAESRDVTSWCRVRLEEPERSEWRQQARSELEPAAVPKGWARDGRSLPLARRRTRCSAVDPDCVIDWPR